MDRSSHRTNIAQIHGLKESGGIKALVMELVEGPTLEDRIAHGVTLELLMPKNPPPVAREGSLRTVAPITATLLALLLSVGVAAQVGEGWTRTWHGDVPEDDKAFSVAVSPDDETVFVAGFTSVLKQDGSDEDGVLLIYEALEGTLELVFTLDADEGDQGGDGFGEVVPSAAGESIYLVGDGSFTGQDFNIWLTKYSEDGVVWTRRFNGEANGRDKGNAVTVSPDGTHIYAVGYTTTASQGKDVWVGKYSADGEIVWTRTYDGGSNVDPSLLGDLELHQGGDDAFSVVTAPDGGSLYVAGYETAGNGRSDAWIRKYSADGIALWTRTVEGTYGGADGAYGLALSPDGTSLFVAGYTTTGRDNQDAWVARYSADGELLWTSTSDLGDAGLADIAADIAVSATGDSVYVVGCAVVQPEDTAIWVREYSSDGVVRWTDTYDGPGNEMDCGFSIAVSQDGTSVYAAGFATVPGEGADIWIRKYCVDILPPVGSPGPCPTSPTPTPTPTPTPSPTLALSAIPVETNALTFISPYGQNNFGDGVVLHDGIDFGASNGGGFFAAADGIIRSVELNTGLGLPGTNHRIEILVGSTLLLDYHFENDGTVSEAERRANVLVSVGQSVTAGQRIGNLLSQGQGRNAHVHFGVLEGGGGEFSVRRCPVEYFSPSAATQLEALYDSGVEKRPSSRANLCD